MCSLRTDARTDGRTHTGWTDRRDVGNSILDNKTEKTLAFKTARKNDMTDIKYKSNTHLPMTGDNP